MAEPAGDGPAGSAAARAPHATGPVLVALVVGQLGVHSAMAGLRMAAPLQALREAYSAWAVGLLLALFALAPTLLALRAGRLADRLGYHRPVAIAAGLSLAGMALALLSTRLAGGAHFALLCGAAMLTGSGANLGMLTIQRTAGVTARDRAERMRMFSWLGIAPPLANVIGPVLAGLVIDRAGFAAAYAALALLPLATIVSARTVPRVAPPPATDDGPRTAWDLLAAPGLKRLLFVNWAMSTCWDVHGFAVPVLGHERGFDATTIGLILGTFTLAVTGVRALMPLVAHRIEEGRMLRGAMFATGLVLALYPLATRPLAMGALALLLGLTLGGVQPLVLTTLHRLTPAARHGEALALRSMAMSASSAAMPLLFGLLGTALGAAVLFWAVGALVAAGSWPARRLQP